MTMLQGVRITDMTSVMFGPYCTQLLADLGAEVIKVEPPAGDNGRNIGRPAKTRGMGALHMTVNRGKKSVVWDLRTDEGKENLRRLVASSDVFIHNTRKESVERMGLGYEALHALHPRLVYVHCTGFSAKGPNAGLPAYDDIIQAGSGLTSLLPRYDDNPTPRYFPTAIADKVAGLYAAYATLAAIVHQLRTGEGQHVEAPMFESVTSFNLLDQLNGATFPDTTGTIGYSRQVNTARKLCPTKDGFISLAPAIDDRWLRFFELAARQDVLNDERLRTAELRLKNSHVLYGYVAEVTPGKTTAEWIALLREANIPVMPANDLTDLFEEPQLKAGGFFKEKRHPTEGRYIEVQPPISFSAYPDADLAPAPHLGEHTEEITRSLQGSEPGG